MSVSALVRDRLAVELCDQLTDTRTNVSLAVLLLVDAGWTFSPPRPPLPSVDELHDVMLDAIHEERAARRPPEILEATNAEPVLSEILDIHEKLSRRALGAIVRAAIVVDEERRAATRSCGCLDRLGPCQHEATI